MPCWNKWPTTYECAIQDPLPGTADEPGGAAPRRRFGLSGSAELRFDVLQLTPQQGNPIPVGRTAGRSIETQAARVPELRTVHYTFFAPDPGDELSEPGPQGLVRTEMDFETPIDPNAAGPAEAPPREAADAGAAASAERPDGNSESDTDDTRLSVPEVVSLQFRYFDGRGWTDGWNSLERKSLPAAVEIQLQIASVASIPARRRASAGSRAADGPAPGTDAPEDAAVRRRIPPGCVRPATGQCDPPADRRSARLAQLSAAARRAAAVGLRARSSTGAAHCAPALDATGLASGPGPRLARRLDQDWSTMNTTRRRPGFIVLVVMIVIVMITLAGLSFVLTLSTENKAVHRQGDQLQLDEALASGMELLKGFCSQSAQQRSEAGGTQDNAAAFGNIVMPLAAGAGDAVTLNIVSPGGDRPAAEVRFGLQNESARLHLAVLTEWERRAPGSAAAALLQLPGMSESTAAAILDWIDADGDPRPGGAEAEYYASQRLPYEPRNGVPALLEELLLVRDVSRQALFGADADSGLSGTPALRGRQRRHPRWAARTNCLGPAC